MNFAQNLRTEANKTFTENGAVALSSTYDACLDLFGTIGALRNADEDRINRLFADAYAQDPLLATKTLFYGRDVRGGLGERSVFRNLLVYAAKYHPEAIVNNIDLIGVYGRYDDLYELIGTPLEDKMWATMKSQFEEDRHNLSQGHAISLLAKWIKTPDASSKNTRKLGIMTAQKLGYSVYDFKRILKAMRKYLDIVERHLSAGEWDKVTYSAVPSRAMKIYRNAFREHDEVRFDEFIGKALKGEAKINSSTLYPYDIVEEFLYKKTTGVDALEAQWRQLPDYVEPGQNVIVMADVSGSMYGRPMATAIGLGMYFAERNTGDYHNLFMTFSGNPTIVQLHGETLAQKISFMQDADWGGSTNLKAAFDRVLSIAVNNHTPKDDMPKSIIVVSDMEINKASSENWHFYDTIRKEYAKHGYELPNLVFWNVDSKNDTFLSDKNRKGVQLCSGQSPSVFTQILKCIGYTPIEMMNSVLNSDRYAPITVAA
ncbi:DUF2828 family protein [bacterium]|nr:DUF2828 family protein [bacterium]